MHTIQEGKSYIERIEDLESILNPALSKVVRKLWNQLGHEGMEIFENKLKELSEIISTEEVNDIKIAKIDSIDAKADPQCSKCPKCLIISATIEGKIMPFGQRVTSIEGFFQAVIGWQRGAQPFVTQKQGKKELPKATEKIEEVSESVFE